MQGLEEYHVLCEVAECTKQTLPLNDVVSVTMCGSLTDLVYTGLTVGRGAAGHRPHILQFAGSIPGLS